MINTHPAFYFIVAGLLVFFAVINGILGNAFYEVANSARIVEYSDNFLIITFVMQHFPIIILLLSMVIAVVLFAKGGYE